MAIGGTLGEVLVRVGVDTDQLETGLAKAKTETTNAGTTFSKIGQYAAAGFAVAGAAALKFAIDAVQSAQEAETVITALKNAIGDNTGALEAQATALQSLTGFQDEEILKADTVLARFQLTTTEIQKLTPLVLDYARATGQDAATAAGSLGKALLGNTRALKAIGIDFTSTGDKARDLAEITRLLNDRVGGASAAFGQTFAGKLKIISAKFDDLKETVGRQIIPVLGDLAGIVDSLLSKRLPDFANVMDLLQRAADLLPPPLREAVQWYGRLQEVLGDTASITTSKADIESWATQIADGTSSIVTLRQKLLDTGASVEDVNAIVGRVSGSLDIMTKAQQDATNAAQQASDALKEQKNALKELQNALPGLIGSVLGLKDAQRELKKAQGDASTTAADLKDKELAVVEAFAGVRDSFGTVLEKFRAGKATVDEVIDQFASQARKAGLTDSQISDLTDTVASYIDKLKAIPTSVSTNVATHFTSTGSGTFQTGGGFAKGFHGVISQPTMMLVGEAGAERVDITPGSSVMPNRSSGGLGAGGGVSIVVNVQGSMLGGPEVLAKEIKRVLLQQSARNALRVGLS